MSEKNELIKNEDDYEDALARVYFLLQQDIRPGSKDADELERLSILIKR